MNSSVRSLRLNLCKPTITRLFEEEHADDGRYESQTASDQTREEVGILDEQLEVLEHSKVLGWLGQRAAEQRGQEDRNVSCEAKEREGSRLRLAGADLGQHGAGRNDGCPESARQAAIRHHLIDRAAQSEEDRSDGQAEETENQDRFPASLQAIGRFQ